jgi:hypothetical protein
VVLPTAAAAEDLQPCRQENEVKYQQWAAVLLTAADAEAQTAAADAEALHPVAHPMAVVAVHPAVADLPAETAGAVHPADAADHPEADHAEALQPCRQASAGKFPQWADVPLTAAEELPAAAAVEDPADKGKN